MELNENTNDILCIQCGSIINSEIKPTITCNKCGSVFNYSKYEKIQFAGYYYYHFYYVYRDMYESNKSRGDTTTRYSIADPETAFIWIASVIFAGIIQDISITIIKRAIAYILEKINSQGYAKHLSITEYDIENIHARFIDAIYNPSSIDRDVFSAIKEEIIAHAYTEAATKDADPLKLIKIMDGKGDLKQISRILVSSGKKYLSKMPNPKDARKAYHNLFSSFSKLN